MSVSNEFYYRAHGKNKEKWNKYTRVRFGISVGKEYHEGDKLRAALTWAQEQGFAQIEVRVSDTLQRYNMPGDPDNNLEMSRALGDAWIERNRPILVSVPNLRLFKWDDVRNDPAFPEYVAAVKQRLCDPTFRSAIQGDIDTFQARVGEERAKYSLAFLTEELAVFSLLHDQRPAVEAYPGTFLTCRQLLRPDFALARIKFKRVQMEEAMRLAA